MKVLEYAVGKKKTFRKCFSPEQEKTQDKGKTYFLRMSGTPDIS